MKWMLVFVGSLFAMSSGQSRAVQAQTWGDLTMTVVLDGEIPPPKPVITQSGLKIMPEDLVVDPATKGIANMVFMIDSKKTKLGTKQLHPDLQELPNEKPILDIVKDAFVPHVLAIRAGQTFLVNEGGRYNVKFSFFKNEEVNPMIPAGANKEVFTKVEEPFPTKVECSIHPWMRGYILVAGHPYVGVRLGIRRWPVALVPVRALRIEHSFE